NNDEQQRVWCWNESARKVYRYDETVHSHWKLLFSINGALADNKYQPFNSHLDWEIAQWAVREQISQMSFNCLLNIPEV
ncbi:hypothetical protein GYMLUDRAFT_110975, partial [Collybiopsis luxurians FD-317 M1]